MSITVKDVPEAISRDGVIALVESLNIDPTNLQELRIDADGIWATVFATDAAGHRIPVRSDAALAGAFAKHTIYIPIAVEVAR